MSLSAQETLKVQDTLKITAPPVLDSAFYMKKIGRAHV